MVCRCDRDVKQAQAPRPRWRAVARSKAALALAAVLLAAGCAAPVGEPADSGVNPADTMPEGGADAASVAPPLVLSVDEARRIEATPPAGIDAGAVTPLTGEALAAARLSLAEVRSALPVLEELAAAESVGPEDVPAADAEAEIKIEGDADVEQAADMPPLEAQRQFARAVQKRLEGQGGQAVWLLEAAAKQDPGRPALLRRLAMGWAGLRNRVRAAAYFRQAVRADPSDLESVVAFGRLLVESGDAASGSSALLYALDRAEDLERIDTALSALTRFYASAGLRQMGHTQAAAGLLDGFLAMPAPDSLRPTRYGAELVFLLRRSAVHHVARGDLDAQLGDFRGARLAYERARRAGASGDDLTRRIVYADLWLGRLDEATGEVLDIVRQDEASPASLNLVEYLVAQGVPAEPLLRGLREMPDGADDAEATTLALASALPSEAALALLGEALDDEPANARLLGKWLELRLSPPVLDEARAEALTRSIAGMRADPGQAAQRAGALLASVSNDAHGLRDAWSSVPEEARASPAGRTLHAVILLELGLTDAAREQLEAALASGEAPPLATIEKARLLALSGEFESAHALLESLGDEANDPRLDQLRVGVLLNLGRQDEALALLEGLVQAYPRDPRFVLQRARILVEQERIEEAERALLDAINRQPRQEALYAALLDLHNNHGGKLPDQLNGYQRLVSRMLQTIPDARITKLTWAGILEVRGREPGNLERAERLLDELLAVNPQDRDALLILVDVYVKTGRVDDAVPLVESLLEAEPMSLDVFRPAERVLSRAGETVRLAQVRERWLRQQPDSPGRDALLARSVADQGRADEAAALLVGAWSAVADEGTKREVGQVAVSAFEVMRTRPLAEAEAWLVRVADEPRVDEEVRALAGYVLIDKLAEAERWDDALPRLDAMWDALDEQDGDEEAATQLAAVTFDVMREQPLARSEAWLTRVVRDDRVEARVRRAASYVLANGYESAGRSADTDRLFTDLLEALPRDAELSNHVGYVWAYAGRRLDEAEQLIARALEMERDQAAYLDSMGWVRYKLGDFAGAERWLRRALAAEGGDNPVIVDHLGDALYRQGRADEAAAQWRKALADVAKPENQGSGDPEMDSLAARAAAKLAALEAVPDGELEPVPVAALGVGVEPAGEPTETLEEAALESAVGASPDVP